MTSLDEEEASSSADAGRLDDTLLIPSRRKRGSKPKDPPGLLGDFRNQALGITHLPDTVKEIELNLNRHGR